MAIYEEARRLLARQEADLDTVRSRAVTIVTGGAVAAGLFGTRLPQRPSVPASVAEALAVVAFAVTVLIAVLILLPRTFGFSHNLGTWIDQLRRGEIPDANDWAYNVSRDLEDGRQTNQGKLKWYYCGLSVLCALLAVQIICWLVAIA